jgi:hypothetical protein
MLLIVLSPTQATRTLNQRPFGSVAPLGAVSSRYALDRPFAKAGDARAESAAFRLGGSARGRL